MKIELRYREALEQVINTLKKYNSILIYIQGSPDPDALASSFAIKQLCDIFDIRAEIVSSREPSLKQNREIIKRFKVPLRVKKDDEYISHFDAYVIMDFQSALVSGISEKIPCALHIDHHEPKHDDLPVDFRFVDENAGSTSTILTLMFKEYHGHEYDRVLRTIGSLLMIGIHVDTDKTIHASSIDFVALSFLEEYTDKRIVDQIVGIPFTKDTLEILETVSKQKLIYKDWLIAGAGFLHETRRDNIAIAADYLLGSEKIKFVAVYAIVEMNGAKQYTLDVSLRSRDPSFNLDFFIKEITPEGGGRKYKGAFQVNLNFFTYCPNKAMLWDLVSQTVNNAIIKKREELPLIELKGIYQKLKNKIGTLFRMLVLVIGFTVSAFGMIGCEKKFGIMRYTSFNDTGYLELSKSKDCALLRNSTFDVAVTEINELSWEKLLSLAEYKSKSDYAMFRIPRLHFFLIVVFNVGKEPISITWVTINHEKGQMRELTKDEIYSRCSSPVYRLIDMKRFLSNKRYLGEKWCFSEMDIEKDIIGYDYNIIFPGETIMRIAVFDWIPVQYRKFSLIVGIKNEITLEENKVAFPMMRKEYRMRGKFFVKDEGIKE
ncbi:MAG: DHH family phosphoesterase [Spirochaetes bacterium]|nr:DHH family phosphoesterase [Spirochaetota bacterium]